jgi:sugar lactone lactonase YvrE
MLRVLFLLFIVPAICNAQYISTIAGTGVAGFDISTGIAIGSTIYSPDGVAVDAAGNVFFTDAAANKVFKVSLSGTITCIAGNGWPGSAGDGGPATAAELYAPSGICIDVSGNLYITGYWDNSVRKVSPSGIISTVAGCCGFGYPGHTGDGGPATMAQLDGPTGIAIDAVGNIYIADNGNNCVRKINAAGIITTFAGSGLLGGSLGDGGPATAAQLYAPGDIALDAAGNVYITDKGNYKIRMVNPSEIITTIAGTTVGYSGDGGPATLAHLNNPKGIALDVSGNLYFSETGNNRIRKIDPTGIISTIAGYGPLGSAIVPHYNGDGIAATTAMLSHPSGIATDATGNLFIADVFNNRVRKVTMAAAPCISATPVPTPTGTVINACDTVRSILYLPGAPILTGLQYQWQSSPDSSVWTDIVAATNITWPDTIVSSQYYRCILTCSATSIASTTAGVKLTVLPQPNAGTITGIDTVCPGHTIELTNSVSGGVWSASNSNVILVGGSVTGVSPGPVTINYVVANSCGSATATFGLNVSSPGNCTGGIAKISDQFLLISPNPTSGMLSISSNEPVGQIIIQNLLGKSVFNEYYSEKKVTIDLSQLNAGLYFISVNGQERKLLKTQ